MIAGIISLLIGMGIPLAGGICFLVRRDGTFLSFLAGVGSFVVSQLVLRIPILSFLGTHSASYAALMSSSIVISYGVAAFTAGLFEETGRLIGFSVFRKGRLSWMDTFAFGLGHGGIEAVWVMCQSQGVLACVLNGMAELFPEQMLAVALERLFAMMFHIGLTFVVMQGIRTGKKLRFWLLAVLIHAAVDFSLVVQNALVIWTVLVLFGQLSLGLSLSLRKKWRSEESVKETGKSKIPQ